MRAKIVLLSNHYPSSSDKSGGFYRRFSLIHLPNYFDSTNSDPDIAQKILKQSKNSLLSWALEGLERLLKNKGHFSKSQEESEMFNEMAGENDPIHGFMEEYVHIVHEPMSYTPRPKITLDDLYRSFKAWARTEGILTNYTKSVMVRRAMTYLIRKDPSFYNDFQIKQKVWDNDKQNACWSLVTVIWNKDTENFYANAQIK